MTGPHVFYIRHGETDWNRDGRFQGRRDIPLNDRGRAQAAAAGSILADLLARDGRPVADLDFVSSPLGRATATIELVRTSLALPTDGYRLDYRLREISYGDWEGLTYPEMKAHDPELFARRRADSWHVSAPAGETYAEVAVRMGAWFDEIAGDTVVVAHGGTMRALLVTLGVATPAEAVQTNVVQGAVYSLADRSVTRYD